MKFIVIIFPMFQLLLGILISILLSVNSLYRSESTTTLINHVKSLHTNSNEHEHTAAHHKVCVHLHEHKEASKKQTSEKHTHLFENVFLADILGNEFDFNYSLKVQDINNIILFYSQLEIQSFHFPIFRPPIA